METYQQTYSVVASDMDVTYHITPNAIMLYFQDCFARFLTSRRLAAFDIIKDDLIWVISDLELNFVKERPLWSSQIKVKIRFSEISAVRVYVDYWMSNVNDEVFAQGTSTWVILNGKTRRPVAATDLLSKGGITAEGGRMKCGRVPDTIGREVLKEVEHTVNVTDLDFNGHVCNRTYLSIAMATQPLDFIQTYSPSYLHIKFAREAFFGEVLTCRVSANKQLDYWYDIINSQGKIISSIYSEWQEAGDYLSKDVAAQIKRD